VTGGFEMSRRDRDENPGTDSSAKGILFKFGGELKK